MYVIQRNGFFVCLFCFAFLILYFVLPWSLQDLTSLTRDWTHAPYIGSPESSPLDHWGSPVCFFLHKNDLLFVYSMDMNLSKLWETVENRGAWHAAVHGVEKSRTQLSDWTTIKCVWGCQRKEFTFDVRNFSFSFLPTHLGSTQQPWISLWHLFCYFFDHLPCKNWWTVLALFTHLSSCFLSRSIFLCLCSFLSQIQPIISCTHTQIKLYKKLCMYKEYV